MKILRVYILSIFIVFILFSCDSGKEVDTFFEGMMELHHKDMVVWGEIPVLKKNIKNELDTFVGKRIDENLDTARLEALNKALTDLESANDAMNDWMHQFKKPEKGTPTEEALAYLSEQKNLMEEMGKEVSEAVIAAKELIKTSNP